MEFGKIMNNNSSTRHPFFFSFIFMVIFFLSCVVAAESAERTRDAKDLFQDILTGFNQGLRNDRNKRSSHPQLGLELLAMNPVRVQEGGPFTLHLFGKGFDRFTQVMVQVRTAASGQLGWLSFSPHLFDNGRLEVVFDRGFSANPPERKIYLSDSRGNKSDELILRIMPVSSPEAVPALSSSKPGVVDPNYSTLEISSISPSSISRATSFSLHLMGSGFSQQCEVFVEVNKNAADATAEPEYDFISFNPVVVSPEELRLDFDLGFGDTPPVRKIFVEDGMGHRSNEVHLRIQP